MGKVKKIWPITTLFLSHYNRLDKENKLPTNKDLAAVMGMKGGSGLSNILAGTHNIQPEQWRLFKEHFGIVEGKNSHKFEGDEEEPTPMQILDRLSLAFVDQAAGFRAQSDLLKVIHKEMARREDQATMSKKLDELSSSLKSVEENQDGDFEILTVLLKRDVDREVKGNEGKAREKLNAIVQKIGPALNSKQKKSIRADGST